VEISHLFRVKQYFVDLLLTEAVENDKIDFYAITATLHAMYVAASDTLKNSLTWLALVLAEYPEMQEKCFTELKKISEINQMVNQKDCHFTNAVLLENFRMFPVIDTLTHQCSDDVKIGNGVWNIPIVNKMRENISF